ncbi:MAG: hypothetical protein QOJ34_2458, partial [Pseudonocardiales bacterium]|nr:hypothetical protein [Pseudonocardiales bacterium]
MKGVPLPAQYSPRTIPGLLAERATDRPAAVAAFGKGRAGYAAVTFAELADSARRLAGGLVERGVVPGDRVAWLLDNSRGLDALQLFHAVVWAGGVNVPINPRLAPPEVADIVQRTGSRLLIAQPEYRSRAAECLVSASVISVDELAEQSPATPRRAATAEATDLTTASILFTSGTTGRPKGVVHTHGSSIAAAIGWSDALALAPGDVLQSPFPVFSGAGLHFNGLSCLWAGCEFVIDDYGTAASLELAGARQTSVYVAVPSIYAFWLDSPVLDATTLRSLRVLDYGGAAMAPALIRQLRERLPGVGLVQTYGLTEAGPGGTYLPAEDALVRLGSIGRRCAGEFTEFRVVDADGQNVVG